MSELEDHWTQFRLQHMSPRRFEELCCALLTAEGHVEVRHLGAAGADKARDIESQGPDLRRWIFQCKRYKEAKRKAFIGDLLTIIRTPPEPRPEIFQLITTCDVSVEIEKALRECAKSAKFQLEVASTWALSEVVARLRDSFPELRKKFIGTSFCLTVTDLLPGLLSTLKGIPLAAAEVRESFWQAAPSRWEKLHYNNDIEELLSCAVNSLSVAPIQSQGHHPLLAFVEHLGKWLRDESKLRLELRQWIERATEALADGDLRLLKQLRSVPSMIRKEASSRQLLIQIEAAHGESEDCQLKAWFRAEETTCLVHGEAIKIKHLAGRISALRRDTSGPLISPVGLQVEVMMPYPFLCSLDCDQWPIELELVEAIQFGAEYPLVLRSLERAADPVLRSILESRWVSLLEAGHIPNPIAGCLEELRDSHLVGRLQKGLAHRPVYLRLRAAKRLVGALLEAPPSADPDSRNLLKPALQAGLGVLLWARSFDGQEIATPELKVLEDLLSRPLFELINAVWKLRLDAVAAADLGSRLTLIWDDPRNPFPDFDYPWNQLVIPERRAH